MLWLGAIALDALFGGRKALGAIPSLDTLTENLFSLLRQRLERKDRSNSALFFRGVIISIALIGLLGFMGALMDRLVFTHAAITALSTATLARYLQLKILFQTLRKMASQQSSASWRKAIERSLYFFSSYYCPALILFLLGGFSFLLPFYLLYWVAVQHGSNVPSSYVKPLLIVRNFAALPGECLSAFFLIFGTIAWPAAHMLQGIKGLLVCGRAPRQWGPSIVAHAFGISLQSQWPRQPKWLGSDIGSADIDTTTSRNALIVALIAFVTSLAFLLVLITGALLG